MGKSPETAPLTGAATEAARPEMPAEGHGRGGRQGPVSGQLLAVDVGLRYGLAVYGADGRLRWYRSCHVPNRTVLRRASRAVLATIDGLRVVVLEGGGPLADIWEHGGRRLGAEVLKVAAEAWRQELLLPREQRSGRQAKTVAGRLARRVIEWSGSPRPTSLRHDAAEAILTGLWGVLATGWLEAPPPGF